MFPPLITLWEEEDELTSQAIYTLYLGQTTTEYGQFPNYGAIKIPDAGKLVPLVSTRIITTGNVATLHRAVNDANYQNGTGIDAHAVLIVARSGGGGAAPTFKIWASNTVDTADGTVVLDHTSPLSATDFEATEVVNIPTTKFLTVEVIGTGDMVVQHSMVVEDA